MNGNPDDIQEELDDVQDDEMSMLAQIQPESDLLNVVIKGEFSLEEAKRTFIEILNAVAFHESKKVLVDGRTILGEPGVIERFYYGLFAAQTVMNYEDRGVSAGTPFAYVLIEPVLDPQRFGETVAVNRCMNVKAFDNPEDALKWLSR
jgi:hypothetical protein